MPFPSHLWAEAGEQSDAGSIESSVSRGCCSVLDLSHVIAFQGRYATHSKKKPSPH